MKGLPKIPLEKENRKVILTTDKYRIETGIKKWLMYIVIDGKSTVFNKKCNLFDLDCDLIAEYNTDEFDGIVIFNNLYEYKNSNIVIMKINPELDGTMEFMGRYFLNKDDTHKHPKTLTYHKKVDKIRLGHRYFKLNKLEKR